METIDFKKDPTYKAKQVPEIVDLPRMRFVMFDGEGAPDAAADKVTPFQHAMQALFGIVYTIKFWDKKQLPPPGYAKFTLAPVEGLWWTTDSQVFDINTPDTWRWTIMLRVPEFVTQEYFDAVVGACVKAKDSDIYRQAYLKDFTEGPSVQLMHIGPYSQEQQDIEKLHDFARRMGYELQGKHHELYFGDPRRTSPEKLRTILRQPITK